ncbi:hypothetical protein L0668_00340 [Paraglaciecola aquimarina]|uniref:MaoC-like domain-containing protein n=1 Tax=Paraglaciecola algarum TaxID=3050085 RepID=A0ABS9D0T7_9ALTE|nr:MaoC/PaaZ C-terminal domain-containing protein [Paraglaciecola sp. G1-23]MCF2946543.1 hypothetical protein [Paraglaciecola sp. G1-23]
MQTSNMNSVKLSTFPKLKWLMIQAPFKRDLKQSPPVLPHSELWIENVTLDNDALARFHQVVNWQVKTSVLHPCFIHTIAFPLHLKLLLAPGFPFPLLGLVHIENTISQFRQINQSETLKLVCRLGELELHKKGWLFSVITECFSGAELVWQSNSLNLFRAKHNLPTKSVNKSEDHLGPLISSSEWSLPEDLGRRYAKASGDFNPIHLRKWSAKLLGFKQQIAHGMWTKSKCVSEIQKIDPELLLNNFKVNCRFKKPLYLPREVVMSIQSANDKQLASKYLFKVETQSPEDETIPHLTGCIIAL